MLMLMLSEDIVDISILVLADWLIVLRLCLCLCLCQYVLTGHYSDRNISISTRRTQRFDILAYAYVVAVLTSAYKRLFYALCLCLCLCLRR